MTKGDVIKMPGYRRSWRVEWCGTPMEYADRHKLGHEYLLNGMVAEIVAVKAPIHGTIVCRDEVWRFV